MALLGPSGSGKTTLLRALAGLEFIDAGEIVLNGRSMEGVPARQRGVGFVFQHYALFRHMTVARNVAFGLEVMPRGRPPTGARNPHPGAGPAGPDGDRRSRRPLPGADFRRPAAACGSGARAGDRAPLLLLDEPFGALDAQVRKNLRVWLRQLHDRMGLTSVFVTHDQNEAMEMADRVAVMQAGRIVQVDTPQRLLAQPATSFVRTFLTEALAGERTPG